MEDDDPGEGERAHYSGRARAGNENASDLRRRKTTLPTRHGGRMIRAARPAKIAAEAAT
jgi:ribosomal protein L4